MSFWESSSMWFEAVIAACSVGAAVAVVGIYTILRRVVFMPAALSQVSGFGVALAFLLPLWFTSLHGSALFSAEVVAAVVTLTASLALGWLPEPRRLSRDGIIGIAYIVASGLILIIGDRIPQENHKIRDILFGNAVAVEYDHMVVAVVISAVVLIIHAVLQRPFLLVSSDPETARAHGVPVRLVDGILFLTIGLTISIATKTIGAMPVFAFAVLPGAAALMATHNIRAVFIIAGVLGVVSAFVGYWISFVWSFPTGSCMAVTTAVFLIPAAIYGRIRGARMT